VKAGSINLTTYWIMIVIIKRFIFGPIVKFVRSPELGLDRSMLLIICYYSEWIQCGFHVRYGIFWCGLNW